MNNNQFTEKSREALQNAQQLTVEYQNQEMAQEHLACALLSDPQGQLTPLRGSKLWQLAALHLWLDQQGL